MSKKIEAKEVKNLRIWEIMEVKQDILQATEHNKFWWYGLAPRMKEERLSKVITGWKPKKRQTKDDLEEYYWIVTGVLQNERWYFPGKKELENNPKQYFLCSMKPST